MFALMFSALNREVKADMQAIQEDAAYIKQKTSFYPIKDIIKSFNANSNYALGISAAQHSD